LICTGVPSCRHKEMNSGHCTYVKCVTVLPITLILHNVPVYPILLSDMHRYSVRLCVMSSLNGDNDMALYTHHRTIWNREKCTV
jgi:hypothetical protein